MNDHTEATSSEAVLVGGGEMGERMRALDWAATPLGPVGSWPQSLRSVVGARVLTAGSARAGRQSVTDHRPDVIVADIGMPEEDGYSLIRAIRALPADRGGTTPAAAVTALARPEDRRRALMAGFQTHVSKPVDMTELVAVVASLAGRTGR